MKFEFTPIGTFYCDQQYRFETPRQGVFAHNSGWIELNDDRNLLDACHDLAGVERIWIVFCFHLNRNWRPFIRPPVSPDGRRIGVFATRAPYRPNPVGLSCVELDRVEKRKLFIRNHDLLNDTPVLDIKPYIPSADSFPDSKVSWLDKANMEKWKLEYSPKARKQIEWLKRNGGPDLYNFAEVQLTIDPFNTRRKRVEKTAPGTYGIGCRTWCLDFHECGRILYIDQIRSHYTPEELERSSEDRYGDKALHRAFLLENFPSL